MLPTTNLDIVRRMRPDPIANRLPEAVRAYTRLEYDGNARYAQAALVREAKGRDARPHGASGPRDGRAIRRIVAAIAAWFARAETAR